MQKHHPSEAGLFNPRIALAFLLCSTGMSLAMVSFAATPAKQIARSTSPQTVTAGTWSIVDSPNTSAAESNTLYGVTCVSASNCWAVGNHYTGSAYLTLTEHWDGTSWTIVASPNTAGTPNNNLYGVACASASNCWAVGQAQISGFFRTLIEHWDGTSWTIVPSPNSGTTQDILQGVTCLSASDCWATGYYGAGPNAAGIYQYPSLVLHWNGTAWSVVPSANTSATQNILWGVACTSPTNCWSAGYNTNATPVGPFQTLIERWNGASWSVVSSANTNPAQNNYLFAVSCTSASDCRAAGYANASGAGNAQTLIERWDGSSWTIESSPNIDLVGNNAFFGIACTSSANCWAAGYYNGPSAIQTLIEHWDGSSWTVATSPNTSSAQTNVLNYVTCSSAYDCWAVGFYNDSAGIGRTLIEHYTVPPVQLIGAVSRKAHGSAGDFDIDLPLSGNPGIECRSGGASGDYTIIFNFANPLSSVGGASVTSGSGSVSSGAIGSDAHEYIVNLTGVTNAQTLTISLTNVTDSIGNGSPLVVASMNVLVGDVTANRSVSNSDVASIKAQVAAPVTASNFRNDVNGTGTLSNTDVSTTKAQVGTTLP